MCKLKSTKYNSLLRLFLVMVSFISASVASASPREYDPSVPNYDSLNVIIHTKGGENYYPDLFKRYLDGDTTLTVDNYHYLYYGYALQPGYQPLTPNSMRDSLMIVLERNTSSEDIVPELFGDLKRITYKSLSINPFDLQVLNMLAYIHQMAGDDVLASQYSDRMHKVKEVILRSGDGLTKNNPIHVISREEQDAILGSLKLGVKKRSYISIDVEYIALNQKYRGKNGLFFDISRIWTVEQPEAAPKSQQFILNPKYNPKSDKYIGPQNN